jgi:molybdate transport system ATP-binding protein
MLRFDCRFRYAAGFALAAAFEGGPGVTALVGPSGSGKTTAIKLIAGLLRPQTGRITLGDVVLFDHQAKVNLPPERRLVSVVFQEQLLFPHLDVRQNLTFGRRRRPGRAVDAERVIEVLELGEVLDRMPHTLSGGQRQRVALGRALLCGPELLLLDEPLAGLEADLKERILGYLQKVIAEYRLPTLLVSHNLTDVARLAERTFVLEGGHVLSEKEVGRTVS